MRQSVEGLYFKRIRNRYQQRTIYKLERERSKLPGNRFLQIVIRLFGEIKLGKVDEPNGKFVCQQPVNRFPFNKAFF